VPVELRVTIVIENTREQSARAIQVSRPMHECSRFNVC
jgi:hypothetical protein